MVADLWAYLFVFRCGIAARWSMPCAVVEVLRGRSMRCAVVEVLRGRSMRCVGGRGAVSVDDALCWWSMRRVGGRGAVSVAEMLHGRSSCSLVVSLTVEQVEA